MNPEGIVRMVPGVWLLLFQMYSNCCPFFLNPLDCRSPSRDQLIFMSMNQNLSFVTTSGRVANTSDFLGFHALIFVQLKNTEQNSTVDIFHNGCKL